MVGTAYRVRLTGPLAVDQRHDESAGDTDRSLVQGNSSNSDATKKMSEQPITQFAEKPPPTTNQTPESSIATDMKEMSPAPVQPQEVRHSRVARRSSCRSSQRCSSSKSEKADRRSDRSSSRSGSYRSSSAGKREASSNESSASKPKDNDTSVPQTTGTPTTPYTIRSSTIPGLGGLTTPKNSGTPIQVAPDADVDRTDRLNLDMSLASSLNESFSSAIQSGDSAIHPEFCSTPIRPDGRNSRT